jgi:hypothetical protein
MLFPRQRVTITALVKSRRFSFGVTGMANWETLHRDCDWIEASGAETSGVRKLAEATKELFVSMQASLNDRVDHLNRIKAIEAQLARIEARLVTIEARLR